jgi:hypothetical protein
MPNKSRSDLAIQVLSKALGSATEESAKEATRKALIHIISAAVAGPTAIVIAAVAKEVVEGLLKTTSSMERKLDQILKEPLQTSVNSVREVLSMEPRTQREKDWCNDRLNHAFDDLAKAYSYAQSGLPEMCMVIRLYQAIVAALQPGGRPFVSIVVGEFQAVGDALKLGARQSREEAAQASKAAEYYANELRAYIGSPPSEMGSVVVSAGAYEAHMGSQSMRQFEEATKTAEGLEARAQEIDLYCQLAVKLSQTALPWRFIPVDDGSVD